MGSKIVAVVQDVFYDYIKGWAEFLCTKDVRQSTATSSSCHIGTKTT